MAQVEARNGDVIDSNDSLQNKIESDDAEEKLLELDDKEKLSGDERIKHKAKRPSAKTSSITHYINGSPQAFSNENDPNNAASNINLNNRALKKFTKNSRRPRGRFGRGLPKKGQILF